MPIPTDCPYCKHWKTNRVWDKCDKNYDYYHCPECGKDFGISKNCVK
jgi:predicted RNA-binding Zn-ribbon protein involved in translation (DUF1610 family)